MNEYIITSELRVSGVFNAVEIKVHVQKSVPWGYSTIETYSKWVKRDRWIDRLLGITTENRVSAAHKKLCDDAKKFIQKRLKLEQEEIRLRELIK
jgi:hypothetical protein